MITSKMKKIVQDLNSRFKYKLDSEQYNSKDYWTFMDSKEIINGDCEDYSLYILKKLSDDSLLKFYWKLFKRDAKLHFVKVKSNNDGHCVLEFNGYFVDNNYKKWVHKSVMESSYDFKNRYSIPVIIFKFILRKYL